MKPYLYQIASVVGALLSTVALTVVASAPAATAAVMIPGVTA